MGEFELTGSERSPYGLGFGRVDHEADTLVLVRSKPRIIVSEAGHRFDLKSHGTTLSVVLTEISALCCVRRRSRAITLD
jgi:hypothetical protein